MSRRKVIDFQVPDDRAAEACVVWCYDNRFDRRFDAAGSRTVSFLEAYLMRKRFQSCDLISWAGGAKTLADGDDAERERFAGQILLSRQLHGARHLVLMVHVDCGAYGDLPPAKGNLESLLDDREADLRNAYAFLRPRLPEDMDITLVIGTTKDGAYEVDPPVGESPGRRNR